MKTCKRCKVQKPLDDFYAEKLSKDGKRAVCKDCKNKEVYEWRKTNQDYYNKSQRDYQATHTLQRDNCDLKRKYGVSRQWFDETLLAQDHKCAICRKVNTSLKRRLAVDHDHQTGKVRGILCYNCNRLLHAFDNSDLFEQLCAYVAKYKS